MTRKKSTTPKQKSAITTRADSTHAQDRRELGLWNIPAVENPFPSEDARHQLWDDLVLRTQAALDQFNADMFRRMPPKYPVDEEQANRDLEKWSYDLITGTFDRYAWMFTRVVMKNNLDAIQEKLNEIAKLLFEKRVSYINASELQLRLRGRFEWWMAEARRLVVEEMAERDEKRQTEATHPPDAVTTRVGIKKRRNLDPEVGKRRILAATNPDLSTLEMCKLYDREKVPLPVEWQDAELKSWVEAHRNDDYKSKVEVLASKDKKQGRN